MLKSIVQFFFDHPAVFWLGLIAFIAADILAAFLYSRWKERREDEQLPSYMRAYDRNGRRIK